MISHISQVVNHIKPRSTQHNWNDCNLKWFSHQQDGTPILLDELYFRRQYPLFLPRFHWAVWSSPNLFLNITSPYTTHQTLLCSLPLSLFLTTSEAPVFFRWTAPICLWFNSSSLQHLTWSFFNFFSSCFGVFSSSAGSFSLAPTQRSLSSPQGLQPLSAPLPKS